MSTITAILEADVDGSLHLPVPAELRRGKLKVSATIEPVGADVTSLDAAVRALHRLRERGTFAEVSDAVAWQREQRKDRVIAGRES